MQLSNKFSIAQVNARKLNSKWGWLLLLALVAIGAWFWSQRLSKSNEALSGSEMAVSLNEAMYYGAIEAEFYSLNEPNQALLTVHRVITSELAINLPLGSFLLSSDSLNTPMIIHRLQGERDADGVVNDTAMIHLTDDSWRDFLVETYTLDMNLDVPSGDTELTYADSSLIGAFPVRLQLVIPEVIQLLEAAGKQPDTSAEAIQAAIWAITSGVDWSELSNDYESISSEVNSLFKAAGLNPDHYRLLSESPPSAQSRLARANSYYENGVYIQALADYTDVIGQDKQNAETYFQRGLVYTQLQEMDNAITDFIRVTEIAPSHPLGHMALGRAYFFQPNPDYERAIDSFSAAIQQDDGLAEAFYIRGLAYSALEDTEKAMADLDQAIQLEGQFPEAYYARGSLHAAEQENKLAIDDFSQAIQIDDMFFDAYFSRAELYVQQEDYSKALADLNKVINGVPTFAAAYRSRGLVYYAMEENDAALQDLQEYLRLNPTAIDGKEIAVLINRLQGPPQVPENAVTLNDAIDQELIEVTVTDLGIVSGDSILLEVQSITEQILDPIVIPQGTILKSTNDARPDMVVRQIRGLAVNEQELIPVTFIELAGQKPLSYFLEAYSLEMSKASLDQPTTYAFMGIADSSILGILQSTDELYGTDGDVVSIQTAIWTETDDASWFDLSELGYHPSLQAVQLILETAELEVRGRRLFGGNE